MKVTTFQVLLEKLGIQSSYSRPRVSNDNPYWMTRPTDHREVLLFDSLENKKNDNYIDKYRTQEYMLLKSKKS